MKFFLLCLGLYMTIFSNAKAQDSSHTVIKDTLTVVDSSKLAITDSIPSAKDSIKTIRDSAAFTRVDSAAVREDTIVDIFSEMAKASEQQDLSMKANKDGTGQKQHSTTLSKDSTDTQNSLDSTKASISAPSQTATDTTSKEHQDNLSANSPTVATKEEEKNTDRTMVKKTPVELTAKIDAPAPSSGADTTVQKVGTTTFSDTASTKKTEQVSSIGRMPTPPADSSSNKQLAVDSAKQVTGTTSAINVEPDTDTDTDTDTDIPIDSTSAANTDTVQKAKIESIFQVVDKQADQDSIASADKLKSDSAALTTDTSRPVAAANASVDTTSIPEQVNPVGSAPEPPLAPNSDSSSLGTNTPKAGNMANRSDSTTPRTNTEVQKGLDSARDKMTNILDQKRIDSQKVGTPFEQLFKPYRKFEKNTSIESTTSLTILQQNVNYKTQADFTTQYQRSGTQGDNFLFDVIVSKLNTEVQTMGVQLKYNSDNQTDTTSTFAKPLFDIVGKRTYLKVDTTGRITSIDTSALARQVNTVLSGLSLSGSDFEVGSNFGLLLNRSKDSMHLGDTWQNATTQGSNKRLTEFKIQNILNDELIVVISGTVEQTGEIVSDGVAFKTKFKGTQKGKLHVDSQTGLIKSKELTLNLKGTVLYKDNALPAAAISKIKENVTYD